MGTWPQRAHFCRFAGPLEFRMGAPAHETAHYHDPIVHYRKVDRSIAVATKEVTVEQFQAFNPGHRNEPRYGDRPGCAADSSLLVRGRGVLQLVECAGGDCTGRVVLSREGPSRGW